MVDHNVLRQDMGGIYDRIYSEDSFLSDADSLYEWILDVAKPKGGSKILDVACGLGKLVRIADKQGYRVYGTDVSSFAIRLALRKESTNRNYCIGDGEQLPFPNLFFDFVTNIGSLEHFPNMELGIQEMSRVLKPGGQAAFLLPNSYYMIDIIWKVWRTGYSPSHQQLIERFASYNEWKDFLELNGFRVLKGYKYNRIFPMKINDLKWYLKFPKRLLAAMIAPFIPRNLSYHFLFLCMKNV